MKRAVSVLTAVFALTIVAGTVPRAAAEYPERAITLINPQSPGGAHDAQGRAFTDTSDWFWAAMLGRSAGPWQAFTHVQGL